jgi:hypothetical protein
MSLPGSANRSSLIHALSSAGSRALSLLTSRAVVVVSTTCAVLYGAFWVLALLQTNGLISSRLPIAVADSVILNRSGANLRPAALGEQELAARNAAMASAQTASDAPQTAAAATEQSFTLEVQSAPPVELWVMDAKGQAVGTDPQSGLVRLQLPGASYSGHGSSPQLVSVPNASGTYTIQLIGAGTGQFQLSVRVFEGQDVDHAVQFSGSGQVFDDTLLQTTAAVSVKDDGTPDLQVSPVQVLVAGNVPPSPSASATASPSASASASAAASPAASVEAATVVNQAPAPARIVGPVAVVRPSPVPRIPIPAPVPILPVAAGPTGGAVGSNAGGTVSTSAATGGTTAAGQGGAAGTYGGGLRMLTTAGDSQTSTPLQQLLQAPGAAAHAISQN